jgi:O-antigen/teichoic acid export membrane protein
MMVFGSGKYRDKLNKYLGFLLTRHILLTILSSILLAILGIAILTLGSNHVAYAIFGLVIASPFILLTWLARRFFYILFKPHFACTGGLFYLALILPSVYILYLQNNLTSFSTYIMMGVVGAFVGTFFVYLLKPSFYSDDTSNNVYTCDHIKYGKWALGTALLVWIPSNIYYLIIPIFFDLEKSASLKAVMNLVMPLLHTYYALGLFIIPYFSRLISGFNIGRIKKDVYIFLLIFLFPSIIYWLILYIYGFSILNFVYDGGYVDYYRLLIVIGLVPFTSGVTHVYSGLLKSLESPDKIFWSYLAASIVTLTIGIGLIFHFGIIGVAYSMLTSSIVKSSMMIYYYHKKMHQISPV